jgi:hypothetical protein
VVEALGEILHGLVPGGGGDGLAQVAQGRGDDGLHHREVAAEHVALGAEPVEMG